MADGRTGLSAGLSGPAGPVPARAGAPSRAPAAASFRAGAQQAAPLALLRVSLLLLWVALKALRGTSGSAPVNYSVGNLVLLNFAPACSRSALAPFPVEEGAAPGGSRQVQPPPARPRGRVCWRGRASPRLQREWGAAGAAPAGRAEAAAALAAACGPCPDPTPRPAPAAARGRRPLAGVGPLRLSHWPRPLPVTPPPPPGSNCRGTGAPRHRYPGGRSGAAVGPRGAVPSELRTFAPGLRAFAVAAGLSSLISRRGSLLPREPLLQPRSELGGEDRPVAVGRRDRGEWPRVCPRRGAGERWAAHCLPCRQRPAGSGAASHGLRAFVSRVSQPRARSLPPLPEPRRHGRDRLRAPGALPAEPLGDMGEQSGAAGSEGAALSCRGWLGPAAIPQPCCPSSGRWKPSGTWGARTRTTSASTWTWWMAWSWTRSCCRCEWGRGAADVRSSALALPRVRGSGPELSSGAGAAWGRSAFHCACSLELTENSGGGKSPN